jgi:hypothetical protein
MLACISVDATFGKEDEYFYVISNRLDSLKWREVFKSNEVTKKDPKFEIVKLLYDDLCNSQDLIPLLFEFYSWSCGKIGQIESSLQALAKLDIITIFSGTTAVGSAAIKFKTQFYKDFKYYIRNGLQLNTVVAIDYTESNFEAKLPKSLHYIGGSALNQYQSAIDASLTVLSSYDHDKVYPVFGFGGRTPKDKNVSHCFPINLKMDNPNINGIDNVISTYRDSLEYIALDGPTYFAPLLETAFVNIQASSKLNQLAYYLLLIYTDGEIYDVQETIDLIVKNSDLPVSIIIIGVGDGKFDKMKVLDSDKTRLTDLKGVKATRDLVQFVEFKKYNFSANHLSSEILKEIPKQVEEYYLTR